MREIAVKFHENYDLLAAAKFEDSPFMPQAVRELVDAHDELERLCEFSKIGEGDALYDHVQDKLASIRRLAALDDYDSPTAYFQIRNVMPVRQGKGRQTDWNADPETGRNACAVLKALLTDLNATVSDELERARTSALMPILAALRDFALDYAEERRRQGRVHFHDMLVFARDLLVKDVDVRDHFRERFTHLLIDESQDTDPIQAEIAMCIAESVQPGERRHTNWERMKPEEGKTVRRRRSQAGHLPLPPRRRAADAESPPPHGRRYRPPGAELPLTPPYHRVGKPRVRRVDGSLRRILVRLPSRL